MKETVRVRWRALGFVALAVVCLLGVHRIRAAQPGPAPGPRPGRRGDAARRAGVGGRGRGAAPPHVPQPLGGGRGRLRGAGAARRAGRAPPDHRLLLPAPLHGRRPGACAWPRSMDDPFGAPYRARFFGPDLRTWHELPLAGLPSRARVSPDGRLGASTVFVNGDSYATGDLLHPHDALRHGDRHVARRPRDLLRLQGRQADPERRLQLLGRDLHPHRAAASTPRWGRAGTPTWWKGDVAARTAKVLRDGVECPSLSPDGTRIAFKQKVSGGGLSEVKWQLAVLDVAALKDHPLAETRSVDDQAEWLDDGTVLYSVASDTYAVPADGSGAPHPLRPPGAIAGGPAGYRLLPTRSGWDQAGRGARRRRGSPRMMAAPPKARRLPAPASGILSPRPVWGRASRAARPHPHLGLPVHRPPKRRCGLSSPGNAGGTWRAALDRRRPGQLGGRRRGSTTGTAGIVGRMVRWGRHVHAAGAFVAPRAASKAARAGGVEPRTGLAAATGAGAAASTTGARPLVGGRRRRRRDPTSGWAEASARRPRRGRRSVRSAARSLKHTGAVGVLAALGLALSEQHALLADQRARAGRGAASGRRSGCRCCGGVRVDRGEVGDEMAVDADAGDDLAEPVRPVCRVPSRR